MICLRMRTQYQVSRSRDWETRMTVPMHLYFKAKHASGIFLTLLLCLVVCGWEDTYGLLISNLTSFSVLALWGTSTFFSNQGFLKLKNTQVN